MGALMRCVPKEMWATLGTKKMVKEALETVNTIKLFADPVWDVNAQRLLKGFKNIGFKEGETADDFSMRITNLVTNFKTLVEIVDNPRIVK
jgi:hypothetical protein